MPGAVDNSAVRIYITFERGNERFVMLRRRTAERDFSAADSARHVLTLAASGNQLPTILLERAIDDRRIAPEVRVHHEYPMAGNVVRSYASAQRCNNDRHSHEQ